MNYREFSNNYKKEATVLKLSILDVAHNIFPKIG
jgi:hypothetical protein